MLLYIIISFCLFFYLHFFWTQKIYYYKYFAIAIIVSLVIPGISFFQIPVKKDWIENMLFTFLSFIHLILLLIVKISYKTINNFLIKNKMLNDVYSNKKFTYIQWHGDSVGDDFQWDEKNSTKPSWLDYVITYILLIFPILLIILIKKWIN
jgi:hypothetical protein